MQCVNYLLMERVFVKFLALAKMFMAATDLQLWHLVGMGFVSDGGGVSNAFVRWCLFFASVKKCEPYIFVVTLW